MDGFNKYPGEKLWKKFIDNIEVEVYGPDECPSSAHINKAKGIIADLPQWSNQIRKFLEIAYKGEHEITIYHILLEKEETVERFEMSFSTKCEDVYFSHTAYFRNNHIYKVSVEVG